MAKLVVFTVALTGLGRRGLRRARGQAGPDGGEAPRARAARQGDSGRDSREARSQEGVTSGLAATDLRTLLHHVCARDPHTREYWRPEPFSAVRGALISPGRYPVGKNGKYEYCHNFSNSKISLKLPTFTDFKRHKAPNRRI